MCNQCSAYLNSTRNKRMQADLAYGQAADARRHMAMRNTRSFLVTESMMEIAAIDHIVPRTSNIEAMLDFYCNVPDCTVERETTTETGLTQLRAGSAHIDLVTVESDPGRMGGGAPTTTENNLDHFCLQLKPISEIEIEKHLSKHGIKGEVFMIDMVLRGLANRFISKILKTIPSN